ncbi:hypothetical protein FD19_GL000634 [Lacticaseibacillus thailandensis DSM 22698 = JCM 13996]|uniref:Uncharacterized protein n=2 Tax=Lacticaseibacillus thailandensis TaxID=381741 RepID=A0A0R2CEA6_9LACO|nr:hypothetical protein FD19_GL000634 [Lacticaseibacillus thailandensis DSM 22698 = JCM 13996]
MEHVAAIMVIAVCALMLAVVAQTHREFVLQPRDNAMASRAAINCVRAHAASGKSEESSQLGVAHYTATILNDHQVRVQKNGTATTWTYTYGLHHG